MDRCHIYRLKRCLQTLLLCRFGENLQCFSVSSTIIASLLASLSASPRLRSVVPCLPQLCHKPHYFWPARVSLRHPPFTLLPGSTHLRRGRRLFKKRTPPGQVRVSYLPAGYGAKQRGATGCRRRIHQRGAKGSFGVAPSLGGTLQFGPTPTGKRSLSFLYRPIQGVPLPFE